MLTEQNIFNSMEGVLIVFSFINISLAVWVCSGAISFPAIVWWRAARENGMPPYKCSEYLFM